MCTALSFHGNKTIAAVSDEVLTMGFSQCLTDQCIVFWPPELKKGTLHGLLMGISGNVDGLHGPWVETGIEHAGAESSRCRVKILDLLGHMIDVPQIFRQFNGAAEIAAGMRGNQVGDQILFLSEGTVDFGISLTEPVIDIASRLSHDGKNLGTDMLGSNFQLTADVILTELPQKGIRGICHDIVIPEARADKDLLDARQLTDLSQQLDIIRMIHHEVFTGLREETLTVFAGAVFELLVAGRTPEIGGRAADIVNIALEIRHLCKHPGFLKDGFMASRGHDASLQKRDGTEAAGAKAAPGVSDGKLDLLNCRNTAQRIIIRMPVSRKREAVYLIQFRLRKRRIRDGLNDIMIAMLLRDRPPAERVLLVVLDEKSLCIFPFA